MLILLPSAPAWMTIYAVNPCLLGDVQYPYLTTTHSLPPSGLCISSQDSPYLINTPFMESLFLPPTINQYYT